MDRVAFELLGIEIYWYALIIVFGIVVAMWLSTRESIRVNMKPDDVTDFMLVGLPVAFIGARLYYVLFDLEPYLADPMSLLRMFC